MLTRMIQRHSWRSPYSWLMQHRRVWSGAGVVAGGILLLRGIGALQGLELSAYDQLVRWRPAAPTEDRVVIVKVDEEDMTDLRQWPMNDATLAAVIDRIAAQNPAAIGLDLYRDLPVEPGHAKLLAAYRQHSNLIGIQKLADNEAPRGILPPPELKDSDRVGFNNILVDADGRMRRAVIYWWANDPETGDRVAHQSLAYRLAHFYLKRSGIAGRLNPDNPSEILLGHARLSPLQSNSGAYIGIDSSGYQILANFRGPSGTIPSIPLRDLLGDRLAPDQLKDKVVLIGVMTESVKDFAYTAHSKSWTDGALPVFGVEIQAQLVSQFLDMALLGTPPIRSWPEPLEWLWIGAWALAGAAISAYWQSPTKSAITVTLLGGGLVLGCYGALLLGWWVPLVPTLLALGGSTVVIVGQLAQQQQELERSKEFLHQIIDTIPDPIFVKDRDRRWIVLNHAYSEFVGRPVAELLDQREEDVLPPEVATLSLSWDESLFRTGHSGEQESSFLDAQGKERILATKRSLHQDRAGNQFLVGVIRDITERKRMEDELKRTAAELRSYNEQLKISEDFLRYQATHDTLTGLPNRQLFYERLDRALDWARDNKLLVALLFLDLDGFKEVNDTQGHDVGDWVLKAVADRLLLSLRGSDTVARLGGDEFTIILPAIPRPDIAARVAQKVLETLAQPYDFQGTRIDITVSVGVAFYPQDSGDRDALIKCADTAMFVAKKMGKNAYHFYDSTQDPHQVDLTHDRHPAPDPPSI